MAIKEKRVWGIHAGRTGDADKLFLNGNCIAIGWGVIGDLNKLQKDRDSFKKAVMKAYPETKPGAIPGIAGQLFRFVHEMQIEDYVVYSSKFDRQIHIGTVQGAYEYNPSKKHSYPNQRKVEWLSTIPRTKYSQGALYEIGSAMSFFQVKNYADEFIKSATGKISQVIEEEDKSIASVAENIEENTRDFILKRLSTELKGHPLAGFISNLLNTMGYRTRVSPEGADGGVDILAHKDELGFEPPIIKVQVKSGDGSIGEPIVSSLYGKVGEKEFGLFITLGTFSTQAKNFARLKSNLRLIDGQDLVELILLHYDQLDSQYKGMIPLKQVFVPQPLEETELV